MLWRGKINKMAVKFLDIGEFKSKIRLFFLSIPYGGKAWSLLKILRGVLRSSALIATRSVISEYSIVQKRRLRSFYMHEQAPSRGNRQKILEVLKEAGPIKGVVLCPVGHDLAFRRRPEHLLRQLADEGYLCIILVVDQSVSMLSRLDERLYISTLTEDFTIFFKDSDCLLYLHYPGFIYFTGLLRRAFVIYDALDHFERVSYGRRALQDDEILLSRADLVLRSDHPSDCEAQQQSSKLILYGNGMRSLDFKGGSKDYFTLPESWRDIQDPIVVGYHGIFSDIVDFDLIERLLSFENILFFAVESVGSSFYRSRATERKLEVLRKNARVLVLDSISYEELKHYYACIDIGLIPFLTEDKTNAIWPHQIFEYLAADKPVVATPTGRLGEVMQTISVIGADEIPAFIMGKTWNTAEYRRSRLELGLESQWSEFSKKLSRTLPDSKVLHVGQKKSTWNIDIVNVNFYDWHGRVLYKGGAERYVYDLAVLVNQMGHNVRIVQNSYVSFEKEYKGIKIVGVPAATSWDSRRISRAYDKFCEGSDLVIASPAELNCEMSMNKKTMAINHGIYWDSQTNKWPDENTELKKTVISAIQNTDTCVCVDTNFINWMRTVDWALASSLRYIPNYVDMNSFKFLKKNFFEEELIFLYPRRLYHARGLYLVIEAFEILLQKHRNIKLVFCGQGVEPDVQLTKRFIARHPDRVSLVEYDMEDMPKAYLHSHVVLVPTMYSEGTSLSCIEALATNNAVVATNVGGLPNLIIDRHNGLLISPNVKDLICVAELLIEDRVLLSSLASRGYETSKAFSKEQWDSKWTAILRDYISTNGG